MPYISIGPNCWGEGTSVYASVEAMKDELATFYYNTKITYEVYQVTEGTVVNELGGLSYPTHQKPVKIHAGTVVVKRRPR